MIKRNKRSSIMVVFAAFLMLLPLSGEAQSISRNKKPQTTKTTTKKKTATNNSTTTKSKQSSSLNSSRKSKKSNKTTSQQLPNSSKPPIYTSNMTQAQKDSIIQLEIHDMVWVEGGTFTMGATPEQGEDASSDAKPAHQVTLSGFYIGKYEVTQLLWEAVMGYNPSYFTSGARLPVERVSWDDCQKFIKELNKVTGKSFRLPTEAEWEYAARGGNKSRGYKYSGSNNLDNVAWAYFGTSYFSDGTRVWKNSGETTHPVGQKAPNELGLYDMSGNVYEWCQDWYGKYNSMHQSDPKGPAPGSVGTYRVKRGGSWSSGFWVHKLSDRSLGTPSEPQKDVGLRLAASSL